EEPRLIALRTAAVLAARGLIHRDVRDRALRLSTRWVVEEIDRGRDRCPAPLGLLLLLHRKSDGIATRRGATRACGKRLHLQRPRQRFLLRHDGSSAIL